MKEVCKKTLRVRCVQRGCGTVRLREFIADEAGVTSIEYGLIAGALTIGIVILSQSAQDFYTKLQEVISAAIAL